MSVEKQIRNLLREDRYEEALSLCKTATENNESTHPLKVLHAHILHQLYRYKEAFAIIKTLDRTDDALITEAAILVDWVSDFKYKNYEEPPCRIEDLISQAMEICDKLIAESKTYKLDAMYFKANALSVLSKVTESRLLLHQVIDSAPTDANLLVRSTINLGNSYIEEGRFIEAIELYEKAVRRMPDFSMGWSGFGSGLSHAFYYMGRQEPCLLYMALFCLYRAEELVDPRKLRYAAAVKKGLSYVQSGFREIPSKEVVSQWNPLFTKLKSSGGSDTFENYYYEVSAGNSLFLNLCLGCRKDDSYSRDKFLTTGLTSKIEDCRTPYNLFSYLAEIRRDYFVARYLLVKARYEGDRELELLNSIYEEIDLLDYSSGNLNNDLLKICLQKSVGIFDKIAFFLNEYEGLDIPHHSVSFSIRGRRDDIFKHIEKKYPDLTMPVLKNLCALKSISNDLKHPHFETCRILRDSITHKYLKVHVDIISSVEQLHYPGDSQRIIKSIQEPHHDLMNPKNYHIIETDLIDICLRTLKISRAAILYLSGHVQCTELNKKIKNPDKIVPSLYFDNILKPKHRGDEGKK